MLDSLFSRIRDDERRFTVYRSGDETAFEERLAAHNVRIDVRTLPPGGPEPFIVLETDGEFAGAIGLAEAEWLLEPPIVRPGKREGISEGIVRSSNCSTRRCSPRWNAVSFSRSAGGSKTAPTASGRGRSG